MLEEHRALSARRQLAPAQLPLWAAALALAAAAASADPTPVPAPPLACVVLAGARSFDLAELGGGSGAGGVPALRHVSRESDSLGWTYSFAACGAIAPLPAACAGAAPGSAALQQTAGACYGIGSFATRTVAATATGVALSFSGGDGGRSSVVTVECADVARPQVVRWSHGAAPTTYMALVRARAGCALECGRDSAGAVCGGKARGACVTDKVTGASRCACSEGHVGVACVDGEIIAPATAASLPSQAASSRPSGSANAASINEAGEKAAAPAAKTGRGFLTSDVLLVVAALAAALFFCTPASTVRFTAAVPLQRGISQLCSRNRALATLAVGFIVSLFAPELGAVAFMTTLRVRQEELVRVGSVAGAAPALPWPRVSSLEGGPLWLGPSPYAPNLPGEPLVGPTVGAVYLTYRQPRAFLNSMSAFRAAYPDGDMVLFRDVGGHNYSHAAGYFGARYFDEPRAFTSKATSTIDMRKSEAAVYLRAMREAVNLIQSPYFMHMETDVFVLRRVKEELQYQINGWAYDKRIIGKADAYVRSVTGDLEGELVLGGFGGSIYETAFWRRVLNNETDMADFVERYFDPVSGYKEIGHDYIVSSLLFSRRGTMGNYEGFTEWFHGDLAKRLMLGHVSVFHGFKHLYDNSDFTDAELAILGPSWNS
jgi:hypothetical protein